MKGKGFGCGYEDRTMTKKEEEMLQRSERERERWGKGGKV